MVNIISQGVLEVIQIIALKLKTNKKLTKQQFSFRLNHLTHDALSTLHTDITSLLT